MNAYVLGFQEIDRSQRMLAGGKGAHLGELSRIPGIRVPEGFCVTTEAYQKVTGNNQELNNLLDQLANLRAGDRVAIAAISGKIRAVIESIPIAENIAEAISGYLAKFGPEVAFAVRSSATAEDLPTASFAGQQDTYLNIIGKDAILAHITLCWASLFTDRAVTYRIQTAATDQLAHHKILLSVVVQKMVFPQAAGILFTADPVSGHRKVLSIDASFGLGEALVSGLVNADHYKVREDEIIEKKISAKKMAIYAREKGGTKAEEIGEERQRDQALTDAQILELARIGKQIEAHFGSPQDIEWCLADEVFYIVQSRPVTTLFPIPEVCDPGNAGAAESPHVYVSVGHQQMMTDAMKPLGLSFFLMLTRAPMRAAGGRLFVDISQMLSTSGGRQRLIDTLGKSDPLSKDALTTIMERNFVQMLPDDQPGQTGEVVLPSVSDVLDEPDLTTVFDLINLHETSIAKLKQDIQAKSGPDLMNFIPEDIQEMKKILANSQSHRVIMDAMEASWWINEKMNEWLGEKNAADVLAQSVPNNVTSEMGLALLDVADVVRAYPEVIACLQEMEALKMVKGEGLTVKIWKLGDLARVKGGKQTLDAINGFLNKYGMRCAGEIDIARTRWAENPTTLIPIILGHVKNFGPNESQRKFEQGRQEALKKEQSLLARLRQLPDGEQKATETKQKIDLIRNLAGFREYPKYSIVSRYFIYKQALLKEIELLVQADIMEETGDAYYLSFEELGEVVRTHKLDLGLVAKRKEDYKSYEKLTPPRLMTSDGEIIRGSYKKENLPEGAIAGLAVSSGVIEGRARVILNMEDASLEDGDILVTAFTDPSWTPLFVSIAGLVTEVGGLMTHGAVIAREYGLPAVVGVEHATQLIRDGQRIRVNGTDGFVEML